MIRIKKNKIMVKSPYYFVFLQIKKETKNEII